MLHIKFSLRQILDLLRFRIFDSSFYAYFEIVVLDSFVNLLDLFLYVIKIFYGFSAFCNFNCLAYRTDEGKPWVLPSVRSVERQMAEDLNLNHEYLSISGLPDYRDGGLRLLLGDNSPAIVSNRVFFSECSLIVISCNM